MKKGNEFFKKIADIDDNLIVEADSTDAGTVKRIWVRWLAGIAACLVFGMFMFMPIEGKTMFERVFEKKNPNEPKPPVTVTLNRDLLSDLGKTYEFLETKYGKSLDRVLYSPYEKNMGFIKEGTPHLSHGFNVWENGTVSEVCTVISTNPEKLFQGMEKDSLTVGELCRNYNLTDKCDQAVNFLFFTVELDRTYSIIVFGKSLEEKPDCISKDFDIHINLYDGDQYTDAKILVETYLNTDLLSDIGIREKMLSMKYGIESDFIFIPEGYAYSSFEYPAPEKIRHIFENTSITAPTSKYPPNVDATTLPCQKIVTAAERLFVGMPDEGLSVNELLEMYSVRYAPEYDNHRFVVTVDQIYAISVNIKVDGNSADFDSKKIFKDTLTEAFAIAEISKIPTEPYDDPIGIIKSFKTVDESSPEFKSYKSRVTANWASDPGEAPTRYPLGKNFIVQERASLLFEDGVTGERRLILGGWYFEHDEYAQDKERALNMAFKPTKPFAVTQMSSLAFNPANSGGKIQQLSIDTFYMHFVEAIDDHRFIYRMSGWEWSCGSGIYDVNTGEDIRFGSYDGSIDQWNYECRNGDKLRFVPANQGGYWDGIHNFDIMEISLKDYSKKIYPIKLPSENFTEYLDNYVISPNGGYAALISAKYIYVYDVSNGSKYAKITTPENLMYPYITFESEKTLFIANGEGGSDAIVKICEVILN